MKLKRIMASILCLAMILSTMGTVAFAAEPDYVAKLAGTDICFENLADAFTTEHNPENKQVMLLKDYTGDLVINNNRVNVFYLENYTFTGQIKVELGGLTLYGQTTISQGRGRIENTGIDGNYPLCFEGENSNHINISNCDIVATEENGVALYSDSMSVKINLMEKTTGENVNITGDVVVEDGFLNIAAGNTVNGDFDVTSGTLNISGGTFTSDVTDYIATGKMVADNGDGTYSVVVDPDAATLADLDIEDGEYLINDAYDFILFRNLIEAGQTGSNVFKITGEIDLDGYTLTGGSDQRFNGTLDGQGNTIKNVTINAAGKSNVGLINNLGAPGVVKNVTLQNVTVDGSTFVGALVGRSRSTSAVDNCHVTGTVDVDGSQHVGALMGNAVNSVTNCSVDATGEVSGSASVGGLVGTLTSVKGEIKGNSVSGISVNGNSAVGGISGNMQPDGVVIENNSVNSVEINGNASAGLVLGWILDNGNEMTLSDNSATDSTLLINGEEKSAIYGEIENASTVTEKIVAIANGKTYTTLKEAINDNVSGGTIYLMGELNEGSIKLPATITNLTIDGQNTAVVKDTVITAADGNSVNYQGLTIKNTTFDNSRFVLGGMRNGDVIYKDLVFDKNKFINIVNTASMAAVHMNLDSEDNEYIENFTFTNNVIDGVTGFNNSGVLLKSIKGDVIFEGNTVSNVAWNAVQIATAKADANLVIKDNEFQSNGSSVLNIAAAPNVILENNIVTPAEGKVGIWYPAEAKIGDVLYATLQGAVDAAEEGDTIVLASDIEYEVNPTADSTNTDSNCLIHTDKDDVITLDLNGKTISVKGSDEAKYDTLAIRNNGNLTIVDNGIARSAGTITLAYDGTQEVGSSQIHSTILNFGTLTVNGGNIKNTATSGKARYAIYNYSWGGNANVTINGGSIDSDSTLALYTSAYDDFSKNTCNVTINGGEIDGVWYSNTGATAGASLTINGGDFGGDYNGAAVTIKEPAAGNTTLAVTGGNFVKSENDSIVYSSTDASVAAFISGGTFSSNVSAYAAEGFDVVRTADKYVVEAESDQADSIRVVYKDITDTNAEGEKTYAIVVKANDGDVINELASVDLSFVYTTAPVTGGNIDFTVAPAEKFAMTRYENTNRYMFNYNGVGNNYEGTAAEITVGTIKVVGYGKFTIATDTADTNIVNATTVNDNLVDSYTVAGATDNDATTGALDISGNVDDEIAVPTRTLKITIDFPNAIEANAADYQDMKVEITGTFNGVNKTVTYDLGEDMVDGSYVVEDANLVLNNAYTVTVSGAGYRTARYTVTMTEDKALRFWNNVMDENQVVEIGKDSSIAKVTFLAGDIVKDNNINIYDLSAVVSYFGTETNTEAYDAYAKYDLNRDGVIDSKDVAYVLVSWNN